MPVGDYCTREVIVMDGDEPVHVAAELMRRHHVGDVVLVEQREDGRRVPVGIVTDRDLVVELLAPGVALEGLAARDIVTDPLVRVQEGGSLFDALEQMRAHRIRRVPVVAADGALVGILTVDDVIGLLAEMAVALGGVAERQADREARRRP